VYAQLVEHPPIRNHAELSQIVEDELLPSLCAEPGFAGAFDLRDRVSGSSITIVLWETAAAAFRPPSEYNGRFRRALATIAEIAGRELPPLSVWEVAADVRPGSRARLQVVQAGCLGGS
jgi:hypothetical protein